MMKDLEVEVPLGGLMQVHGAGLRGSQQVEAAQGLAGQGLGALGGVTWSLLQEAGVGRESRSVAGGVEAGAVLDNRHVWPAGGSKDKGQVSHAKTMTKEKMFPSGLHGITCVELLLM